MAFPKLQAKLGGDINVQMKYSFNPAIYVLVFFQIQWRTRGEFAKRTDLIHVSTDVQQRDFSASEFTSQNEGTGFK